MVRAMPGNYFNTSLYRSAFNALEWLGLLSQRCRHCETDQHVSQRLGLCPGCTTLAGLRSTVSRCTQCGLRLGEKPTEWGWTLCRHCKAEPQPGQTTVVCADYAPPWDDWITQFKYQARWDMADFLGQLLFQAAVSAGAPRPDLLVPVPSPPKRARQRGYNQAALLAHALGSRWRVPVDTRLLQRLDERRNQAGLGRSARLNDSGARMVCTRALTSQLTIGLVDDVITTGATVARCRSALMLAGAQHIHTFALCRTPE